ncbi:MAG: hypothetical protein Q8L86_12445 [Vicinamibacterales bacterium]|nr:hypothetical protein [Vicinamibacterales bacterium]
MSAIKEKLRRLIERRHLIPDEFWVDGRLWVLDQEDGTAGAYEVSQERLGITRSGEIVWGFSSGCSCWSGWENGDYCPTKSYKEFSIVDFTAARNEKAEPWEDTAESNLNGFLLLVSETLDPREVLGIGNQEIRRYLIKRIGFQKIKDAVSAVVLHTDGTSELLECTIGAIKERYVKVKDASTEREYLLYVPDNVKTCREGIAWTFGLSEKEYDPAIET